MRARYYDAVAQQFISRDPLEGVSGQPYVYAGGNPVNATDPTGMWLESAIDIASLVAGVADINENGLNWGNGIGLVADVVSLALPVVGGVGFAVRGLSHADNVADTVRLYRVEGIPNQRFDIGLAGDVTMLHRNKRFVHVGFDPQYAKNYLRTKVRDGLPGAHITSFEVQRSFLERLRREAQPQGPGVRGLKLVDPTKGHAL